MTLIFVVDSRLNSLFQVEEFIGGKKKCNTEGAGVQQGIGHLVTLPFICGGGIYLTGCI